MSSTCSLLLVEDDQDLREILARRLVRRGFKITTAAGPQEALEAIETSKFQVAVVDRTLPDLGGLELMRRLKQVDTELRIVMMSGTAEADAVEHALGHGACEYLTKPFPLADLEAAIERAAATV